MRFPEGIAAQPDVLAHSGKAVSQALSALPPLAERDVVALVGIGASEHGARSAAPVWRSAGLRAVAISASELQDEPSALADVYVGLSESGRSAETIAALSQIAGGTRVGITNFTDSPLQEVVDHLIALESGPDSPVYTTGYTATLQALGLLGEHWSGRPGDWSAVPQQAADVLAAAQSVIEGVAPRFADARIVDVVASGASFASAGEGALLLRESARLHTAAHETFNYLHGPMEPLDPTSAVLVVGDGREVRLAHDTSALGCPTLLVTSRTDVHAEGNLQVVTLPGVASALAQAILQILPIQMLGWSIASDRSLAVDGFRYHQDDIKLGLTA